MVDNRGKLGAPRPLGFTPFAQSSEFTNRFLSGGASNEPVFQNEPTDIAIIVTVRDGDVIGMRDELQQYIREMERFFAMEIELDAEGKADIPPTGDSLPMLVAQVHIMDGDTDVTLSQVEDGAERAVSRRGVAENVMALKR